MRRANPLKSCFRFGTRALSTMKPAATFTAHCGTLTRLSLAIPGAAAWGFHVVAGRVAILQLTAAQLDPPGRGLLLTFPTAVHGVLRTFFFENRCFICEKDFSDVDVFFRQQFLSYD
jgi:hypothetical protein